MVTQNYEMKIEKGAGIELSDLAVVAQWQSTGSPGQMYQDCTPLGILN